MRGVSGAPGAWLKSTFLPTLLRGRMTLVVVVLVLGATFAMTSIGLLITQKNLKKTIGRQQDALLISAARSLDNALNADLVALQMVARAMEPEDFAQPALLSAKIARFRDLTAQFTNIAVFDRQGDLLLSMMGGSNKAFNTASRPFFHKVLATRRPVISEPFSSGLSKMPVVVLSVPVLDAQGEVAQVFNAGISLKGSTLLDQVAGARQGRSGYMYILTGDGTLVSHPDQQRVLHKVGEGAGLTRPDQLALSGFEGWTEARNAAGLDSIVAIRRASSTGWIIVAIFPTDEALQPMALVQARVALAALLFAAAAGAVAYFITRRLLRPLATLRDAVAASAMHTSDIGAGLHQRGDEVGQLARQFSEVMRARSVQEREARHSALVTRTFIERAPDAFVCCDVEGRITEWNLQAQRTFGWTRDEVLGLGIADVIIPERMRGLHRQGMLTFRSTGHGPLFDKRVRVPALTKGGAELQVELSLAPVEIDGQVIVTAFLHDISDRIAYEEQIVKSEKRLRMVADSMPALIAYIDRDQRYRFTNAHFRHLVGLDPEAMIGRTMREMLGEASYRQLEDKVGQVMAGQRVHFEREGMELARKIHFMIDYIPDIDADGRVNGFYAMVMDISDRKESELRQAASERRAELASQSKSEFIANISHEIRTPMNAVLGLAQLLMSTPLRGDQREYLELIQASGLSLISILNDVLDFSKMEAGKMELVVEEFDVCGLIDGVASIMALDTADKAIDLAIGIAPDMPQRLVGDVVRIQQILTNLVGNAVKFTNRGAIAVRLECRPGAGDGVMLDIAVDDSGIGIAQDKLAQVFESFSQADSSTTRRYGGTGLGLSITRHLVNLMGGRIDVDSTPGQGTCFRVKLPMHLPAATALPQRLPGRLLLILCAEPATRDCLPRTAGFVGIDALAYDGFDSLLQDAASGKLALSRVTDVAVSLELLDRQAALPWRLHAAGLAKDVAVLLICSARTRSQAQEAAALHGYAAVSKPVTPSALRGVLAGRDGAAPTPVPAAAPPVLGGTRILLVEDNELNRVVARGMFSQLGAVVAVAANGREAVEALRRDGAFFDLVFMDIQMPEMDGFEATREIRNTLKLAIPIVAMTAGVMAAERQRCFDAGMNDFVAKPVEFLALQAAMTRQLRLRTVAQGREPEGADREPKTQGREQEAQGRELGEPSREPEAQVPEPEAAPAPGVFDPSRLMAVNATKPAQQAVLRSIIGGATERAGPELLRAKAAFESGDAATALSLLHGLRGSLGSVGGRRFAEASLQAEAAIRAGGDAGPDVFGAVQRELALFKEAVDAWLAGHATSPTKDDAPAAAELQRLHAMLVEQDMGACELYGTLKRRIGALLPQERMQRLDTAMADLDFDTAGEIIAGLTPGAPG
ncbi:MAG: PAS domain S-box protein [Pseudomonadota bacterium]